MNNLKLGLIGAGNRAKELTRFINNIDKITITAVADLSQDNIKELCKESTDKPNTFKDYKELLKSDDVEAVLISTPNSTHADIAVESLNAGKSVYLEKPMATTAEDCNRVVDAVNRTNLPLMVGHHHRYSNFYQKIDEILKSEIIGSVRMIMYKELRGPFLNGTGKWRTNFRETGGTLLEKSVHQFDLYNWFSGSRAVKAAGFGGSDVVYTDRDIMDNAMGIIEYENGVKAFYGLSLFTPEGGDDTGLIIVGENGVVYQKGQKIIVKPSEGEQISYDIEHQYKDLSRHGGIEFNALNAFVKFVRNGTKPLSDAETGRDSILTGIALEKAIAESRVVKISEIG